MAQIPTQGPDGSDVLSVTEFTRRVKTAIERAVPRCWVRGEVSNLTHHSNGHIYFSLKDARAQVSCVLFRQDALRLRAPLKAGQEVVALGEPSLYEPQGRYQLVCRVVVDVGQGELQRRYEALKAKLDAEGLFAASRKRPLPQWPKVVAVVTSPTGAAIADFISILSRRGFRGRIVLIPSRVQGDSAAAEIVAGIRFAGRWAAQGRCLASLAEGSGEGATERNYPIGDSSASSEAGGEEPAADEAPRGTNFFVTGDAGGVGGENAFPRPDLLVVMRGGGSPEDLWPFNEETVARALAASPLPTISAVGHQIDFSLSDFAADVRAETPSGAAELIATGFQALLERRQSAERLLQRELMRSVEQIRNRVQYARQGVRAIHPQRLLERHWQRLDELHLRLNGALQMLLERRRNRLATAKSGVQISALAAQMAFRSGRVGEAGSRLERISTHALAPLRAQLEHISTRLSGLTLHQTLARGYALVRDREGRVVSRKKNLNPGDLLAIDFADGEIIVRVEQI